MDVTILLVVASCLVATGCCKTYYVVAPGGAPCPSSSSSSTSSSSCQELSNYTSQPSVFFTNNTVIYFLEGHHMLHQQDLVMISGVTNLTLQGLGTMETGPHETVIQSTVIIRCSRSTGGFIIMDSQSVTISTITMSGCVSRSITILSTSYGPAAMGVVNSYNTRLQHVDSEYLWLWSVVSEQFQPLHWRLFILSQSVSCRWRMWTSLSWKCLNIF